MFDSLRQDITGAIRGLIKSPGFAAAALSTLALGIGATSAIFSVVKAVLMTPLPYSQPERTVLIFTRWFSFENTWTADQEVIDFRNTSNTLTAIALCSVRRQIPTGCGTAAIFSVVKAVLMTPLPYSQPERTVLIFTRWISFEKTWIADQEVIDFRNMSKTMTAIAAWNSGQQNLTGDGEPVRIGVGFVTANTFDVLGARPLLGRAIREEEDVPNGPEIAVLGYPLWQARYGGDPNVIGKRLMINDVPVEVIGVMPEGFRLPTDFTDDAAEPTQLWRPQQWNMAQLSRNHGYFAAATLAPGQSAATVTEELRAITQRLTEQGAYPVPMKFSAFA